MVRELLHSSVASSRFSTLDGTPDALPTVGVYAGTTLLGSATVTADGTDSYRVTYTLPSTGIAAYTEIWGKVEYDVDTVAVAPQWLLFGVLVSSRTKDANFVSIAGDDSFIQQFNDSLEAGMLNPSAYPLLQALPTASEQTTHLLDTLLPMSKQQIETYGNPQESSFSFLVTKLDDVRTSYQDTAAETAQTSAIAAAVWGAATRTLTSISDSAGITTLLSRITGLLRTKSEDAAAETAQTAVVLEGLESVGLGPEVEADITAIKAKTDLIMPGSISLSTPVLESGQLRSPLVIGDDYLDRNGRALRWFVPAVQDVDPAAASCLFGLSNDGEIKATSTGEISVSGVFWVLMFELPRAETEDLKPGAYTWSVEVRDSDGTEITQVLGDKDRSVMLVRKAT